jgi:predicted nucleic acid-binding protein
VTQLIRSLYLDTNIFVMAARPDPLAAPSNRLLEFIRARQLAVVGSDLLRQEIVSVQERLGTGTPLGFYWEVVVLEMPLTREVQGLGERFAKVTNLKVGDARHLAFATLIGADAFLSWNRRDLVRPRTIEQATIVNEALGLKTPTILVHPAS